MVHWRAGESSPSAGADDALATWNSQTSEPRRSSSYSWLTQVGACQKKQADLRTVFDAYDEDKDGTLNRQELDAFLHSMDKHNITQEWLDTFLNSVNDAAIEDDFRRSPTHLPLAHEVDFEKFQLLFAEIMGMGDDHEAEARGSDELTVAKSVDHNKKKKLRASFHALDADGDGFLSRTEIRSLLKQVGKCNTEDEIERVFQSLDKSKDGDIQFEEFQHVHHVLMRSRTETSDIHHEVSVHDLHGSDLKRQVRHAVCTLTLYWIMTVIYGLSRRDWTVLDCTYFAFITFTTIGYGDLTFLQTANPDATNYNPDFTPTTFDKIFGGFYVFFGVAFMSTAIGVILDYAAQRQEQQTRQLKEVEQMTITLKRKSTFHLKSELRNVHLGCLRSVAVIVVTCVCGAGMMMTVDRREWTYAEAFYWACVTMTTVGYGDCVPTGPNAKFLTLCYAVMAYTVIANAMISLAGLRYETRRLRTTARVLQQFGAGLDHSALGHLTTCNEIRTLRTPAQIAQSAADPFVTRAEFVIWQLLQQGKLDMQQDVLPCLSVFDKLDSDSSGRLNKDDIEHRLHKLIYSHSTTKDIDRLL